MFQIKKILLLTTVFFYSLFSVAKDSYFYNDTSISYFHAGGVENWYINDARLNFTGHLSSTESNSKFTCYPDNGSIYFAPGSSIANNQHDQINARPLYFYGTDYTRDSLIFSADFVADNTGYDTNYAWNEQSNWTNNGFSVMLLDNITLVLSHSMGHPSIHKKTYYGHTHHGVIWFSKGGPSQFIIKDNNQVSDCQIRWDTTLYLYLQKNLDVIGEFEWGSDVYFGTGAGKQGYYPMYKRGPGILTLSGSQQYDPGTIFYIEEGEVVFKSNPAKKSFYHKPNLAIDVKNGAICSFSNDTAEIATLASTGSLNINNAHIIASSHISLNSASQTTILNSDSDHALQSDSSINLSGALDLPYGQFGDTIKIASAATGVKGTFSSVNSGFTLYYKTNEVYAIQTEETSSPNLLMKETKPFISFYNTPENPFFTANENTRVTIRILSVLGTPLSETSLQMTKEESVYLRTLFPALPSNRPAIIVFNNGREQKAFKFISY